VCVRIEPRVDGTGLSVCGERRDRRPPDSPERVRVPVQRARRRAAGRWSGPRRTHGAVLGDPGAVVHGHARGPRPAIAGESCTAGLSVAVVERELVGGECSCRACVPSLALLRPVIAVADARRVDGARQAVTGPLDTEGVFARRNRYVTDWDDTTCLVEGVDGAWLYTLGDVNHRALLTHQGKYQGRTAGDAIGARAAGRRLDDAPWGDHATTADPHAVPQVFFTDPEAAAVGLTAEQATAPAIASRPSTSTSAPPRAPACTPTAFRVTPGWSSTSTGGGLLGVTFVGPGVSELPHSATVVVAGEVPLKRLRHAIACLPAVSEIWLFLLAEPAGQTGRHSTGPLRKAADLRGPEPGGAPIPAT
jgi:hypothetical protein